MSAPLLGFCWLQWSATSLWYLKLQRNLSAIFSWLSHISNGIILHLRCFLPSLRAGSLFWALGHTIVLRAPSCSPTCVRSEGFGVRIPAGIEGALGKQSIVSWAGIWALQRFPWQKPWRDVFFLSILRKTCLVFCLLWLVCSGQKRTDEASVMWNNPGFLWLCHISGLCTWLGDTILLPASLSRKSFKNSEDWFESAYKMQQLL